MHLLATSTFRNPTTDALVIILILTWLTPIVICAMKGKPWFAFFGFIVYGWVFAVVGAIRLAKPNSWWDRRRYSIKQHTESLERFEYQTDEAGLRETV
jgi:hypothetical protein